MKQKSILSNGATREKLEVRCSFRMQKRKLRKFLHYTGTVFIPLIIAMMGVLFWVKAMSDMEWLLLSPKHVVFGCIASLGLVLSCIYADRMLCHEVSNTV